MSLDTLRSSAAPRALFHVPMGGFNPMIRGAQVTYSSEEGALSVDQAASLLRETPEEQQATSDDAPEGEPEAEGEGDEPEPEESEAEPTAEDAPDPDDEPVIEGEEDAEPESDPDTPAIAAPKSWDAAERATFASLPRKAQEIILARETERDRAVSKAQQEAGEARKTVETELAGLAQYKTVFDQVVTNAKAVFAGKWDGVDWVAYAQQDPEAYLISRAQFEADSRELHQTQLAQQEAEKVSAHAAQVEFQNYVKAEHAKLSEIAPHLVDPEKGADLRGKTVKFLHDNGIPEDAIRNISAFELALAYDGMRYREGKTAFQAASAAKPKAPIPLKTTSAPARAAVPTAAAPVRPQRQRTADSAMQRLKQTGRVEDGVAALRALRGA